MLALKRVGFSLAQIRVLGVTGPRTPERWRRALRKKLAEIDREIAHLEAARRTLTESLACECDSANASCALLEAESSRAR